MVEIAGALSMVVVPANRRIVLADLREILADEEVSLAEEADFNDRFPDCEPGAMPPFGNLYGLPVYVAHNLATERKIAFNAGSHREVIQMSFADYFDLVKPVILDFAMI